MSAKPVRLQLSRRKGFNLQEYSRSVNGLDAVNCARPGRWGNPFRVGFQLDEKGAVEAYRQSLLIGTDLSELRGKNLACWCEPQDCCHVDVLLKLARDQAP